MPGSLFKTQRTGSIELPKLDDLTRKISVFNSIQSSPAKNVVEDQLSDREQR
jgi:hypothetical protein